jgi:hypothetical protein
MWRYLIVSIILISLGACALIPAASQVPSTGSTDVQSTAVRNEGTTSPESAVITFQRSGGFAGKTVVWTIYPDGRVQSDQGTTQLSSGDVSLLVAGLKALGIFDLEDSYGGMTNCKDCFTYTITINADGKTKTISTTDGATDTPAELGKILTLINEFITKIPNP